MNRSSSALRPKFASLARPLSHIWSDARCPPLDYNGTVSEVASEPGTAKILIVDDDEGVTQTFARMLRLEGYQVSYRRNCRARSSSRRREPARRHHPGHADAARRRPWLSTALARESPPAHHSGRDRDRRLLPRGGCFEGAPRAGGGASLQTHVARGSGRARTQPCSEPATDRRGRAIPQGLPAATG